MRGIIPENVDPIKEEVDPSDYDMDEGDIRFILVAERVEIICRSNFYI